MTRLSVPLLLLIAALPSISMAAETPSIPAPPTLPSSPEAPIPAIPPVPPLPPVPPVPPNVHARAVDLDEISGSPGDAFSVSGHTIVSGRVQDQLFAVSGKVEIPGHVGGDVYLTGGELDLLGSIAGDLYALAGNVRLRSGSRVGGSVHAVGGEISSEGSVGGDLQVQGGKLILAGPVGGSVKGQIGELVIRPGASIGGALEYKAPKETVLPEGVTVGGATNWTLLEDDDDVHVAGFTHKDDDDDGLGIGWAVWRLLSGLVLGAVFLAAGGSLARRSQELAAERPAFLLGAGFALAFVVPAAALIAACFILPIPLSIAAILALAFLAMFGRVVTALALGSWILRRAGRDEAGPYAALAVGLFVIVLLAMIPVLGFFVAMTSTMLGMGALVAALRERRLAS